MNSLRDLIVSVLAAVSLPHATLEATEAQGIIEGDRGLLAVLSAAQSTASADFPSGTLTATVHSDQPEFIVDAKATVTWGHANTYWNYEQVVTYAGRPPEVRAGEMIETPASLICYWPELKFAQLIKDRSKRYLPELQLRPDQVWFRCTNDGRTWSEFLDVGKAGRKPTVPFDRLKVRAEGPLVVVERQNEGGIFTITSSLDQGGNVTHYRVNPSSTNQVWYEGSCDWSELPDKRWRLNRHKYARTIRSDGRNSTRNYELSVTSFDPVESIDPNRFTIGSLNIPDGTVIDEVPPSSEGTYRKGQKRPPTQDILDDLANEMRKAGFASPVAD